MVFMRRLGCAVIAISVAGWTATSSAQTHGHHAGSAERIGQVRFDVSCTPEAQATINRAVALLHSFWFQPAQQAFEDVAKQDPSCAMAHWGVAMVARDNPLAAPPSPSALAKGKAAVDAARAIGAKSERERAYIEAIGVFFDDHDTKDHRSRVLAHEAAMAKLAAAYPDDREATVFYALALNMAASPGDKTYANQLKAGKLLEAVLQEQPQHPGVAHYLIHTYDYPPIARQGLDAAQRYATIAPDSPHALHMPSHVFTRVGSWEDSIASNRASAETRKKELNSPDTALIAWETLHAYDYMVYAHLQMAQDGAAKQVVDEVAAGIRTDIDFFAANYAFAAIPARYALERHRWDEAARLRIHPERLNWEKYPHAEAIVHFARAVGAARSGDIASARAAAERLKTLHDALVAMKQGYWAGQVEIQGKAAAAWIDFAEGRRAEALAQMREAAELEAATEKHIVSPGPIVPARELLGYMLLEAGQPGDALTEFEKTFAIEPNRYHGIAGAARAAELAGRSKEAKEYYARLLAVAAKADSERPEMQKARQFLAQN